MTIYNKFQYYGVYKNLNPDSVTYHRLIDICTFNPQTLETWGKRRLLDESIVLAVFYNCDVEGVYISPRTISNVEDKDLFTPPYAIALDVFLKTHVKI